MNDSQTYVSQDESSDSSTLEATPERNRRVLIGALGSLSQKPAAQPRDQKDADQVRREEEDALAQAEIWIADDSSGT